MMTVAAVAFATPMMAQDATTPPATDAMPAETMPAETMPAETMPADGTMATETAPADMSDMEVTLSAENPGLTANWLQGRAIYTTNEPSTTEWTDATGDAIPGEWNEIATVSDIVMSPDGQVMGYIADIGGFLGMGTHTVLLDNDALNMAQFGDDTVLATNYSQEELEALPEFDTDTIMD
ncbi:PRC-barrel domain-containing protein [Paracoccus nototheniae]|uniref:PRC-barrel domain-containing protein n=1 Tax=Paracoccus nototheniae TaxID=2489002 RepID=A0ABW4DUW1_9RHOB|nr:PRC-barrel domain-containing protein [Paracoccus nototheniae]